MAFAHPPAFVAAGGSRHPAAADWSKCPSGSAPSDCLLAYGAGCNVALWATHHPHRHGVRSVLRGSHGTVNAVRFMHLYDPDLTLLLTGSDDGVIQPWIQDDASPTGFSQAKPHAEPSASASINDIATLPASNIFASASADARVRLWSVHVTGSTVDIKLEQQIKLSPQYFALALNLVLLDGKTLILAAAGTAPFVQVFTSPYPDDLEFKLVATLTGHEAWVRSLDFARETSHSSSDLLLASASQDKYVRLWRFHEGEQLPAPSQAAGDPLLGSSKKSLSNKAHRFETPSVKMSITFEALLVGHEDWIFSAQWSRPGGRLTLLTASADSSLSIWQLDPLSGIWIATARLGEISPQKGATTATGSAGGFWNALWSPNDDAVACLGRTGSWRLWCCQGQSQDDWSQDFGITGHTSPVRDIAWSRDGTYLLSTSSDQTTRLFSEWKRRGLTTWHELSRPQIHGYDLNCLAALGPNQFVSGADEKLLRVFNEPRAVAEWLKSISGRQVGDSAHLPDVASIPVLGLSNKEIEAKNDADEVTDDRDAVETDVAPPMADVQGPKDGPPSEDLLSKHLLWPEAEKLYGHGYEIGAVAANNSGTLIATACKATSLDHAVIRLYDTATWLEVKPPLKAHTLTVTALRFSHDDRYLLSVGRDRQCVVWESDRDESAKYRQLASDPKAHSRMILSTSWAPLEGDRRNFATAGRDKAVHLWSLEGSELQRMSTLPAPGPVTALAFLPRAVAGTSVLACGLEDGSIFTIRYKPGAEAPSEPHYLERQLTPAGAITSLAWRPETGTELTRDVQLAVSSEDMSLRILNVQLET